MIFAGQVIVGNCVSVMVMVNEHVAVFVEKSLAWKRSVVVPIGNREPDASPAVCVTVGATLQLSDAATLKDTVAPHCPGVLLCVILVGHVMVGASSSKIST